MPLNSAVQLDTHICIEYNEHIHIYSEVQLTLHTFMQAVISAQIGLQFIFYFIHTHIHTCVEVVGRPSRLFPHSSLSFKVHEMSTWWSHNWQTLVQPFLPFVQSTVALHLSSAWNGTLSSCVIGEKSVHWITTPQTVYKIMCTIM